MTTVFEVGGDSMAPGLARGSRVLVVPLDREIREGEVVLLHASEAPVLHRVVLTFVEDGTVWLVHRGDRGGRPAVARGSAVVGRAVAVLAADLQPVPSPDDLEPRDRRAFRRAQWRARARVWGRRAARALRRSLSPAGLAERRALPPSGLPVGGASDRPSARHRADARDVGPAGVGLRIAPGLVWRIVDGEAAIVDLAGGRTVGLNRTAALVWSLLADHDEPAIVEAVAERFEVDAETARADVRRLLAALRARGLVVEG